MRPNLHVNVTEQFTIHQCMMGPFLEGSLWKLYIFIDTSRVYKNKIKLLITKVKVYYLQSDIRID